MSTRQHLTGRSLLHTHDGRVWARLPLCLGWDYYVRFAAEEGSPVVAELRVLPALSHEENKKIGAALNLDSDSDFPEPSPPEGGLTARALRDVQLGAARAYAQDSLKEFFSRFPGSLEAHGTPFDSQEVSKERRPGRKGRPDSYYARVARAYIEALESGSRKPTADAADALGYSDTHARDLLHEARRRELLTRPPRGRAGGELTKKGREALER